MYVFESAFPLTMIVYGLRQVFGDHHLVGCQSLHYQYDPLVMDHSVEQLLSQLVEEFFKSIQDYKPLLLALIYRVVHSRFI